MISVIVYSKSDCEPCKKTIDSLNRLKTEFQFELVTIDIEGKSDLLNKYGREIPVVKIGPYTLQGLIEERKLAMTIQAAIDREKQLLELDDKHFQKRIEKGRNFSRLDKISLWLSKYYIWLITLFLTLYVGLPFLAPVLARNGADLPAKVIYTIYKPLCHQLAFRSWFLFGEQAFYPREIAGLDGILNYEDISGQTEIDVRQAQKFIGNEIVGYKVALCERDTAIYASMLLFTLVFIISGRRLKSLPWYIWLVIGLIPIGLDGASQLPSLVSSMPSWIPLRESNPLLRTITGTLFGLTTAWYLFPLIEESMLETKTILLEKIEYQRYKFFDLDSK